MKSNCLIGILIFPALVYGQQVHKDQYEYGYKGKVKEVVKKTYNCGEKDCELVDLSEDPVTTHTYYYNPQGNIDSVVAGRYSKTSRFVLTNIYQFTNSRKSGW